MNSQEYRTALSKFRDEPIAHPLDFRPSIERLLEVEHCNQLASAFWSQQRWERRTATPDLGASLPDRRGVYMFVWRPSLVMPFEDGTSERSWWVLYVGKAGTDEGTSDTVRSRYRSEYSRRVAGDVASLWSKNPAKDRRERLERYLSMRPLEYWFLLVDSPRDVQALEKKMIRLLTPPLNVQHAGPRLRSGTPTPAF
jgi:hypothetical protein